MASATNPIASHMNPRILERPSRFGQQDSADDRSYDRADQELDDAAAASVVSLDEVMGDNRDVYHHESEQCAEVYE